MNRSEVWDKEDRQQVSLSWLLKEYKFFDASEAIDNVAKEGIELNKLPEHFVLDEHAKKKLVEVIEELADRMCSIEQLADCIRDFLVGYAYGLAEASVDKNIGATEL